MVRPSHNVNEVPTQGKRDYPGTNLLHYKGERAFSPLAKEGSEKSSVLEPKYGVVRRGFYTPRRGCRSGIRD